MPWHQAPNIRSSRRPERSLHPLCRHGIRLPKTDRFSLHRVAASAFIDVALKTPDAGIYPLELHAPLATWTSRCLGHFGPDLKRLNPGFLQEFYHGTESSALPYVNHLFLSGQNKVCHGTRLYPLEIEHMRLQIRRQRSDILRLQRAGIDITSAEALLSRMQDKVDGLCAERERLVGSNASGSGRL